MAHALRYLIAILLCSFTGEFVHAQPSAPTKAAQSVRFTVFSARPIAGLAFAPRPNAPAEKVVFYPTARSPRYDFRGEMPLRFVDVATGAVVAEATIPSGIRDAFLLFSPIEGAAAGGGLRYQIAVLDDGAERHASGGLAIVNLSGLALSGRVNDRPVTLRSGLNPTLRVGRTARIALTTPHRDRAYQSYAATLPLARGERALLILFPPFYRGSLEVQSRLLVDQPPGAE
jgi:hypothetical protein